MFRLVIKGSFFIFEYFIVLTVFLLTFLAWRTTVSPLQVDFLKPYIQTFLNQDNSFYRRLTFGTILVQWEWKGKIDIVILNTEIQTADEYFVSTLSNLLISFYPTASVHSEFIVPFTVEARDSYLYLRRDDIATVSDANEPQRLDNLGSPSNRSFTDTMRYFICQAFGPLCQAFGPSGKVWKALFLEGIKVVTGVVRVDDHVLGTTWTATDVNFELMNTDDITVNISCQLLLHPNDRPTPVTISVKRGTIKNGDAFTMTLSFSNVRPNDVFYNRLQMIADIDLALSGTVVVHWKQDLELSQVDFSITSSHGVIRLPAPYSAATTYYNVHYLSLDGKIQVDDHTLTLSKVFLDFGEQQLKLTTSILWKQKMTYSPVLRKSTGRDNFDTVLGMGKKGIGNLEKKTFGGEQPISHLTMLSMVFGSLVTVYNYDLLPLISNVHLTALTEVTLDGLSLEKLPSYWPIGLATNLRTWITENLHDGLVNQTHFVIRWESRSNITDLMIKSLYGKLMVHDATVSYFKHMSPIRHINGEITIHQDRIELTADGGEIQNLKFGRSRAVITGLDQKIRAFTITTSITGQVSDVLQLVGRDSLRYSSTTVLGIQPEQVSGLFSATLILTCPMETHPTLKKIVLKVKAHLSDFTVMKIFFGHDLKRGDLTLEVDNTALHISGWAAIADAIVYLNWYELFFCSHNSICRRYTVRGYLNNSDQSNLLSLNLLQPMPIQVSGLTKVDLNATVDSASRGTLAITIDLTEAKVVLPDIEWSKLPGQLAAASGLLHFTANTVYEIDHFRISSENDLNISGCARFTQTGFLKRITFERFQIGSTDLSGILNSDQNGDLFLRMTGNKLDVLPLAQFISTISSPYSRIVRSTSSVKRLTLEITTRQLLITAGSSEESIFENAILTAQLVNGICQYGSLTASVDHSHTISVTVRYRSSDVPFTSQANEYSITIFGDEAGAFLRAFGLSTNIVEGRIQMKAILDNTGLSRGTIQIKNYYLISAPLLARLLTVAALTGVLEFVTNNGIYFTNLDMPFTFHDGVFFFRNLRAFGPSLGLTASGKLSLRDKHVDVKGEIVPIYAINSLVGNIPLFGEFITGEKGNGLFSVNYTMTGHISDPTVTVNPLVVIAPGFLRKLF